MTKDKANRYLSAILTTAADVEPLYTGESVYMLGIGATIDEWTILKQIMQGSGLATFEGNAVRLTDAGRAMASKIAAFVAS